MSYPKNMDLYNQPYTPAIKKLCLKSQCNKFHIRNASTYTSDQGTGHRYTIEGVKKDSDEETRRRIYKTDNNTYYTEIPLKGTDMNSLRNDFDTKLGHLYKDCSGDCVSVHEVEPRMGTHSAPPAPPAPRAVSGKKRRTTKKKQNKKTVKNQAPKRKASKKKTPKKKDLRKKRKSNKKK